MAWKFFNSSGQEIVSDTVADSSVTLAKMAANSIDSTQYVDGSIDRVHLAADIIDGTKIADDVINSEHYAAASIDNEHLADDAVGIAELSATGTASSSTFLRGDNAWVAAGGIASVVADTTPQLGGNLDMQARLLVGNGGSTGIAISSAGEVTMAAQPSVLAYNSADIANVTGDGEVYTIIFNTDGSGGGYDKNGDFNTSTSQFTAPIAGRYAWAVNVELQGLTSTHIDYLGTLVTSGSGRSSHHYLGPYVQRADNVIGGVSDFFSTTHSGIVELASGETAHYTIDIGSGGETGSTVVMVGANSTFNMALLS